MYRKPMLLVLTVLTVVALLAACAPQTVTVTVPVEKTVEVEKQVVVTATPSPTEVVYPRNETIYTSGKQWGPPSSWNPLYGGDKATGLIGLCYETLFLYDPLKNEFIPWLAESGKWTADNVYEAKIRQGIEWQDGKPLTAADVVFSFEVRKIAGTTFNYVWEWLEKVEAVDDYTVRFTFSDPRYQEWGYVLYSLTIVPKHIWETRSEEEITTGQNIPPVGSGAYVYETHSEDRMVWKRNENWWATKLLGKSVAPKYIVDIVNPSNNVALGLFLKGEMDLSNNFLPGINTLVEGGYGVKTWYDDPPYMLSANTAFLFMNTKKKPMDDPAFRRAMAYAINVDDIVNKVYGNIVAKANPTGLLPVWEQYVDQAVVDELGFTYNPDEARRILAAAGYKDVDGDGWVEAPDGSKIELKVIVPFGWTDWMESIKVIANSAQAVGINLQPEFPDFPSYWEMVPGGNFDMAINNFGSNLSSTPWTFYNWLFNHPLQDTMFGGNFGRYENPDVFALVDQLDRVPVEDIEGMKAVMSQIQRIQLTEMPAIPMWYNGLWAQWHEINWTNWPSAAEGAPKYLPCTWEGYWNMTAILMLTELKPVQK